MRTVRERLTNHPYFWLMTKGIVEFADLAIIDLSKAHTPEGRQELYPQLRDALRTHGFVYAINHGYTQAQV